MTWRRWVLAGGAVTMVAIVAAGVFVLRSEPAPTALSGSSGASGAGGTSDDPGTVAGQYLTAWSRGEFSTAGALTDDSASAVAALTRVRSDLALDPDAEMTQVSGTSVKFRVSWTLDQGSVFSYDDSLTLVQSGQRWLVHWTPTLIHPRLTADGRLELRGQTGAAAVLDRDGTPLLSWQRGQAQPVDPNVAPLLLPGMGRVAGELAGKGKSVVLTRPGAADEVLYGEGRLNTGPLTSTLSGPTQAAAQAAVDGAGAPAMLVAIQPSTGDLLAVAQNTMAGAAPTALTGLYAPGSTFKIATATAVLEGGKAGPDTVLPCPSSVQIGQRTIPNDDGFAYPPLPLHSAFAHSCNTTFAQLASELPATALVGAADQLGLNADFAIPGISTEAGKIVAPADSAAQVESAIGQGTDQASPFGLALAAATVAAGKAVTPRLWHGTDPGLQTAVTTPYQAPPGSVITELRSMMREVVTAGTATGLRGSGEVYGKTGTAQFGDGSQANGWFAGYRGDVAFAVLLLDTNSSTPAVSVAAAFLR
ncbi:MAG TPA: penicillin-binding transpeptidase domain-containing protein [Amycolatopsis sp.]|nr:penicillin-binding transpeptidase domain-containing protein [Amycolatopsis sp.]